MKKIFSLLLVAALSLGAASAQFKSKFENDAFRHLGMSLEVGTTGFGVNLSYPLVTNHLNVSVGYNFPTISFNTNYNVAVGSVNSKINQMNQNIDRLNREYHQSFEKLKPMDEARVDLQGKINFGAFKVMLEYYPNKISNFHITAGVFICPTDQLASIEGVIDPAVWAEYTQACQMNRELIEMEKQYGLSGYHVDGLESSVGYNIAGDSFILDEASNGKLNADFQVYSVKPYIGLGFGNSIPKEHRLGFQMELGLYYEGKPSLESPQKAPEVHDFPSNKTIDDVMDYVKRFNFYPQLSFRLTGRLF